MSHNPGEALLSGFHAPDTHGKNRGTIVKRYKRRTGEGGLKACVLAATPLRKEEHGLTFVQNPVDLVQGGPVNCTTPYRDGAKRLDEESLETVTEKLFLGQEYHLTLYGECQDILIGIAKVVGDDYERALHGDVFPSPYPHTGEEEECKVEHHKGYYTCYAVKNLMAQCHDPSNM